MHTRLGPEVLRVHRLAVDPLKDYVIVLPPNSTKSEWQTTKSIAEEESIGCEIRIWESLRSAVTHPSLGESAADGDGQRQERPRSRPLCSPHGRSRLSWQLADDKRA